MFLWLFLLSANQIDIDTAFVDSTQARQYETPTIIYFGTTGSLDSSLNQSRRFEPISFLSGFSDIAYNSPFLWWEKSYTSNLLSPYPYNILINAHYLSHYFFKNFNFSFFPINFISFVALTEKYTNSGVKTIDLNTKVNKYTLPYSYLYFTLFGLNTIYNIDFTRALTNSTGFYLGGLYSRYYKSSESLYLRTNAGYANIYCNQIIPIRLDIIITKNSYDTIINSEFSDVTLTAGKDLYKFLIFRTANKFSDVSRKNQILTYGTQHKFLFSIGDVENIFEARASIDQFTPGKIQNKSIILSQNTNYKFNNLVTGVGCNIDYASDKIYFEPAGRLNFQIFNDAQIFFRTALFNERADFITKYGNEKFFTKTINIIGNPDINDENHFHQEIGLVFKNSTINFYNTSIKNKIIYQPESNENYSAINVDDAITGLEGIIFSPVIGGFSVRVVCHYLINERIPSELPDYFVRFTLDWQRKTERLVINIYTKFDYVDERYGLSGNHYEPFFAISSLLSLKFLTLNLGVVIDNLTDVRPADFPNMMRRYGLELKWEFWD